MEPLLHSQHPYRVDRSTDTALYEVTEDIRAAMENKEIAAVFAFLYRYK